MSVANILGFFRFPDLPAELRNRYYEMSMENTQSQVRRANVRPRSNSAHLPPYTAQRRLRHVPNSIGKLRIHSIRLTQVCQQIRSEFRPMRLRTHTIGLCGVQVYVYAFIEQPRTNWTRAFDSFQKSVGLLRIHVLPTTEIDILTLLRLNARHLTCNIEITSAPKDVGYAATLRLLLANRNQE
ncbi:hypothetical protein CC86DRAFT_454646 [Ophiobolus disseminans]|uniref:Uncharacterized protein n=1 Tax=Ophiobolus disseminans TaxID=1469910 RepID=A0A6A7A434_9PLEO|nr:hypothetical protein CC86DRAFT_454646 [Ophiobolus disseminans]